MAARWCACTWPPAPKWTACWPAHTLRPLPEQGTPGHAGGDTTIAENPGWNIKMIGADKVWDEFGARGKGIVVGQSDTGVDAAHPR